MERDYYLFKTRIGFGITTDNITDPQSITNKLQLLPSRTKKIGDTWVSKRDGREFKETRMVWAIDSEWTVHEDETVSHHIEYFKKILSPKAELIQKYKEDSRFDVSFWIWIETDYAGIGLELTDDELKFLNEYSNWVHFSLLPAKDEEAFEKSIANCLRLDESQLAN